eukprot:SAG22_NODE_279_length_13134_cov_7.532561_6_plen_167_part_00
MFCLGTTQAGSVDKVSRKALPLSCVSTVFLRQRLSLLFVCHHKVFVTFPEPPRTHEHYDGLGGGSYEGAAKQGVVDAAAADGDHLLDRPMLRCLHKLLRQADDTRLLIVTDNKAYAALVAATAFGLQAEGSEGGGGLPLFVQAGEPSRQAPAGVGLGVPDGFAVGR